MGSLWERELQSEPPVTKDIGRNEGGKPKLSVAVSTAEQVEARRGAGISLVRPIGEQRREEVGAAV
jgi:hypothetical protein